MSMEEKIARAILARLEAEAKDRLGLYVNDDDGDLNCVTVDGTINLLDLARIAIATMEG